MLLVALLVSLAQLTPVEQESAWQKSALVPHVMSLADWSKEQLQMILGPFVEQGFNLSGLW
ncbi:hypothetical protein CI610_03512 [invertebrate metagenome]|uniref:Uncharacterized protein n=1 Tax=invertebrate metagenome TaxID=1711999 RepID=A0A2H9T2Y6_9ZZZZ